MKKVLHISISDANGGAAIAAYRLHVLMNKTKTLDSKMLVLIKNTTNDKVYVVNKFQRQRSRIGLYFDKLVTFNIYPGVGLFSPSIFGAKIRNNLLVEDADIIYLHWINNGFLSLNEIGSLLNIRKPVILFCHDMWYFTGGCHQSNGCDKFKISCNNCHFFKTNFGIDIAKQRFEKKRKIFNNSNNYKLICPSKLFENLAINSLIIQSKNVCWIPNIIDETKYKPLDIKNNKNFSKFTILYGAMGGKTNIYKGWDYFVKAIELLPPYLKEKIEIVLFGYLFTKHEIEQLPFHASSVGYINDEERMIKLYQRVDLYVFPSLQESFGQTLYEAMACGVPSVAFPVGAVNDLIDHKKNGYIAKYKSVTDLAQGIQYILREDKISEYSLRARKKIESSFGAEQIINKHIKLIDSVIT